MDQKPYRTRPNANRPSQPLGTPVRPPQQSAVATMSTSTVPANPRPNNMSKKTQRHISKKRLLLFIIPAVILCAGIAYWLYSRSTSTLIDGNAYQAVFLSNGQVYFGKLKEKNTDYSTLTDVYYFESNNSTSTGSTSAAVSAATAPKLIKLGEEIHKPRDQMAIKNNQILFFENISTNGQVAKAIMNYQQSQ